MDTHKTDSVVCLLYTTGTLECNVMKLQWDSLTLIRFVPSGLKCGEIKKQYFLPKLSQVVGRFTQINGRDVYVSHSLILKIVQS